MRYDLDTLENLPAAEPMRRRLRPARRDDAAKVSSRRPADSARSR